MTKGILPENTAGIKAQRPQTCLTVHHQLCWIGPGKVYLDRLELSPVKSESTEAHLRGAGQARCLGAC